MIEFLIYLIVVAIVFGLIWYVVGLLPLPEPFGNIIRVAIVLIFILVLLGALVGYVPAPRWPGLK